MSISPMETAPLSFSMSVISGGTRMRKILRARPVRVVHRGGEGGQGGEDGHLGREDGGNGNNNKHQHGTGLGPYQWGGVSETPSE